VAARAYREALAELDAERGERERLEAEAAGLAEQLRQLEQQLVEENVEHAESDLRHLLDARERELDLLRAELAEQRSRYSAVAGGPAAASPAPWSRVDDDLLERIARAKDLAGQD
jgi:hypothetical protein